MWDVILPCKSLKQTRGSNFGLKGKGKLWVDGAWSFVVDCAGPEKAGNLQEVLMRMAGLGTTTGKPRFCKHPFRLRLVESYAGEIVVIAIGQSLNYPFCHKKHKSSAVTTN